MNILERSSLFYCFCQSITYFAVYVIFST